MVLDEVGINGFNYNLFTGNNYLILLDMYVWCSQRLNLESVTFYNIFA